MVDLNTAPRLLELFNAGIQLRLVRALTRLWGSHQVCFEYARAGQTVQSKSNEKSWAALRSVAITVHDVPQRCKVHSLDD
jgi:hypothetical protein